MGGRASRLGGIAALCEAAGPAQAGGRRELGDLRRVVERNSPFQGGWGKQGTMVEVGLRGNTLGPRQASVPSDLSGSSTGRWSWDFTSTCAHGEGAGSWQRLGLWERCQ